jgi:hypothetical protein
MCRPYSILLEDDGNFNYEPKKDEILQFNELFYYKKTSNSFSVHASKK